MVYNEDDLNPVKGTIGELLYANFMRYQFGVVCRDPDMQKKGIDWRIEIDGSPYPIDVDVKFSDKLEDFFAVTYRNSSNIRMPFHKNCEATWLIIVTFNWQAYLDDNKKMEELILARDTRDTLRAEFNLADEFNSKAYPLTKRLIKNYVTSIVAVKVQRVVSLCEGFDRKHSGESNTDEQGNIVATRVGTDIYAAAHIKWNAIPATSKIVHYENKELEQHASTKPLILTAPFPYKQNDNVKINEFGKTLEEMSLESLLWLLNENKSSRSSFKRKVYKCTQEELDKTLNDIIKSRSSAK